MIKHKAYLKKVKSKTMKICNWHIILLSIFFILLEGCSSSSEDSGSQGDTDNIAPSVPLNLIASNIMQTSVDFAWSPSTDNVAVASYSIFINNSALLSTTTT